MTKPAAFLALTVFASNTWAGTQIQIPDAGWRLWPDTQARWREDKIFLPNGVRLGSLPRNAPTGGWSKLSARAGVPTNLPSTVEAHYWGKFGLRPYKGTYYYEGEDKQVKNGSYEGVSWWWRDVVVPKSFARKRCLLKIRGARQRAEIYVNQRLAGYTIMAESAYECDVTGLLLPGRSNQIAVRITNPGGRVDWPDWETLAWGGIDLQKSHGFGGLDRGITITAQEPVAFKDAWVLNTPKVRTVRATALIRNDTSKNALCAIRATILDPQGRTLETVRSTPLSLKPGEEKPTTFLLSCPAAKLWSPEHPNLYRLRFDAGTDQREVTFGFRWFTPDGIGKNAILRLNGDRIRVFSAISWGFWGINGLFPTPELAVKEVAAAKRLGLNCLNFHRNVGKEEVFAAQDRMGLLRYMEPGGGGTAIGAPGASAVAKTDGERYSEEKIIRMVRDFRSHPSLILYVLENERGNNDSNNPRIAHVMRRMHAEDPSRTIVLKSGLGPRNEVWMRPYDETIYTGESAGWWDNHTVGYPDATWRDENYQGPGKHVYATDNVKEIVDWGEMGGSGTPDDHAAMIRQMGASAYDLADHREILSAYDRFLAKWGFRTTSSALFRSVGGRQYEYWANVLGAARLADANDFLTLSGWETTAVENHSGVVDNLRNFHGDPGVISDMLRPTMPVAWPRQTSVATGASVSYDLWVLNEAAHPNPAKVQASLTDPRGRVTSLGTYAVPMSKAGQFVYPIRSDLKTPALKEPGAYRLTVESGGVRQSREILAVAPVAVPALRIGLIGSIGSLADDLAALGNAKAEPFRPEVKYDLLIAGGTGIAHTYSAADDVKIMGTDDPTLFRKQAYGKEKEFEISVRELGSESAGVSILFAENYHDSAGARRFDVRLNGTTVLKDFDLFTESGGTGHAVTKTFSVQPIDGTITLSPGHVAADNASFAGIKVVSGGKTVAYYFGDQAYTDKQGLVWLPYRPDARLGTAAMNRVREGTPLLVNAPDDAVSDSIAKQLSAAGAFRYGGLVGRARAPWMGSWTFVRKHPTYDGLPVDEAMHGDYGIGSGAVNGLMVDGPGVEVITGYGRDHDRHLGTVDFTAKLGQGRILFHALPPANAPLQRRWLANALRYLSR